MAIVDQTGMRLRTALEAELAVTLHWCDLTSLVVVDNPSLCHMAGAQQMQQLKHARSCARIRSRIKNTTLPSRPNANSIASAHYVVAMHAYIPVVGVVQPTGNTRCSFVQQKKKCRAATGHITPSLEETRQSEHYFNNQQLVFFF
jgi:hypothetical protein